LSVDSLLLSSLQLDAIGVEKKPIPKIPRIVWEKIVRDNSWVSSYIDSAGDIGHFCINIRKYFLNHECLLADLMKYTGTTFPQAGR
jgi:hypothetical protein